MVRKEFIVVSGCLGPDGGAVFDGLGDVDVFDGGGVDGEGIFVEDDEVGAFALFERAFGGFFAVLFCGPCGHGEEAFVWGDALIWADGLAGAGGAVDGGVEHHHLVERGDDEVGVVGGAEAGIDGVAHGADVGGLFGAAVGDVGVGEVESVERVEGWADAVLDEFRDLVAAEELGVDGGDVPWFGEVAGACEFVGGEEGVDGGVAVAVEDERDVEVVDLFDHAVDERLGEGGFADPVLLAAGAAGEVGCGEEGGAALGGAVDGDFDAADFEVIVVGSPCGDGEFGEDLVEVGDEGEGDDVDDAGAGGGGALHELELGEVGGTFLGGGDAGFGVEELAGAGGFDFLGGGEFLVFLEDGEEGGFHDEAPWFVGAFFADDDAAFRGFGGGADAVEVEGEGIEDRAVHGDVVDADGVVWEGGVEVAAVEEAAVGHDGVVVAVAGDELAFGDGAVGGELFEGGDDGGDVLGWAGGRWVELALIGDGEGADVVAVAVDEAWEEGLAGEVDDGGVGALEVGGAGEIAGVGDEALGDGDGFDGGRGGAGHGEDGAVVVDDVGEMGGGRRGGGRSGGGRGGRFAGSEEGACREGEEDAGSGHGVGQFGRSMLWADGIVSGIFPGLGRRRWGGGVGRKLGDGGRFRF